MNVLMLAMGQDTGGVLSGVRRAFHGESGWTVHTMVATRNYIQYQVDIPWRERQLAHWWEWADLIHVQHKLVAIDRLTNGWHGFHLPPRAYVVSFHGTNFRENPGPELIDMDRFGALGLASTLDLWLLAPERIAWQPNPTSVADMQKRRRPRRNDDVIRIAHAPTNRAIKSTEAFLQATKRLEDEGHPIKVDVIEGVNWDTCLERKAKADIYFDQVILGYGNNAIEAWGMGIPVIAGAAPATLAEMERRFGELPFYCATEATIYDALLALLDPDLRAEYSAKGLAHVRRFHDEAVVVEQLKDIYQRAAAQGTRRAA